jgi:PKD repeat protein
MATVTLTASPGEGPAPLAVSFTATPTPAAGETVVGYAFDYGDGVQSGQVTGPVARHTYRATGDYAASVTLTCRDAQGVAQSVSASADVVVSLGVTETATGKWIKIKTPDYDTTEETGKGTQMSYLRLGAVSDDPLESDPDDAMHKDVEQQLRVVIAGQMGQVRPGTFLYTSGDFQNVVKGSYTEAVDYGVGFSTSFRDQVIGHEWLIAANSGASAVTATVLDTSMYGALCNYGYSVVPLKFDMQVGGISNGCSGVDVSASNGFAYSYSRLDSCAVAYSDTTAVFTEFEVRVVEPPTAIQDATFFGGSAVGAASYLAVTAPVLAIFGAKYIKGIAKREAISRIHLDESSYTVAVAAQNAVAFSAKSGTGSKVGVGFDVADPAAANDFSEVCVRGSTVKIDATTVADPRKGLENFVRGIVAQMTGIDDITRAAQAATQGAVVATQKAQDAAKAAKEQSKALGHKLKASRHLLSAGPRPV